MARPTFEAAKQAIFAALRARGWAVKSDLKIPHATSPDGALRLWFKPQAVWFTEDPSRRYGHSFAAARSTFHDVRDHASEKFAEWADREAAKI